MEYNKLGAAMKRRRRTLGNVSQEQASNNAGVSRVTWQKIEAGEPGKEPTYAGIEQALGWPEGTCAQIIDGAEPPGDDVAPTPNMAGELRALREEVAALRSAVDRLAESR